MRSRFLLPFIVFAVGCKSGPISQVKEVAAVGSANQVHPIVVLAGGFNSCPNEFITDPVMRAGKTSQMYEAYMKNDFQDLMRNLFGKQARVLTTCFTGTDRLAGTLTTQMKFRFGWNTGELLSGHPSISEDAVPQGEILKNLNFLSSVKLELHREIELIKSEGGDSALILIGHSYGGAVSMSLAAEFSPFVRRLVTIDPIDPVACQAGDMMTSLLKTVTATHIGCTKAPDSKELQYVAKQVYKHLAESSSTEKFPWINFYQDSFVFLHSGPIVYLPNRILKNRYLKFSELDSIVLNGDYHSQLPRLPTIWSEIKVNFESL